MKYYLGIDIGSVSTNLCVIDQKGEIIDTQYIRTHGDPLRSVQKGLLKLKAKQLKIEGVGVTGSGRNLISAMVGGDVVKNEITAHAVASTFFYPDVRTIIEIGGQDSKIIIIRDGIVVDFAMNNVCAAGTGSFLDQQASRLGIPIEEFGSRALTSTTEVSIAGRCTVFAESDMVHKQQLGYTINDIINGLCRALVRNYFNTVGKGKEISQTILFQGGVAANEGIRRAFNDFLGKKVTIPKYYNVMGAVGCALLARKTEKTNFKGYDITDMEFQTTSFCCKDCPNNCEVVEFHQNEEIIARFGDKCGKHGNL